MHELLGQPNVFKIFIYPDCFISTLSSICRKPSPIANLFQIEHFLRSSKWNCGVSARLPRRIAASTSRLCRRSVRIKVVVLADTGAANCRTREEGSIGGVRSGREGGRTGGRPIGRSVVRCKRTAVRSACRVETARQLTPNSRPATRAPRRRQQQLGWPLSADRPTTDRH